MAEPKKVNVFDFVRSITETKEYIWEGNEAEYSPYVVNKALSFNLDCLFDAMEINRFPEIPPNAQYLFYLNSLNKKRRYGKWVKKDSISSDIALLQQAYGYSVSKALVALEILTDKELLELKHKLDKGGKNDANKRNSV